MSKNLTENYFSKPKNLYLRKIIASFLLVSMILSSTPAYAFALATSASTGDEGDYTPSVSISTGDSGSVSSSASTGDEEVKSPATSTSTGDESVKAPATSGSTGDEGKLPTSPSTGDEGKLPTTSSTGDEGKLPTSPSTGDESGKTPATSGSTGDEGKALPPTSGSTGDEGTTTPPTSGSVGDEGPKTPPTSGSTGDEGGALPPTSPSTGDEGATASCSSIVITSPVSVNATESQSFYYTFGAVTSPVTTDKISFSLKGSLPLGLIFNPTDGSISGTPTQTGTYHVLFTASIPCKNSDVDLEIIINPAPVTVCPAPGISSLLTAYAVESQSFLYSFSAVTSPVSFTTFSYSISGALPTGLSFDSATGIISGTPTQIGTFTLPVTVTIPCGNSATTNLVLVVNSAPASSCPVQSVFSPLVANGQVNTAFSYVFSATSTPATSTIPSFDVSGTLPKGLSFSASANTISGTPTESGTFSLVVSVTNTCGTSKTNIVINIDPEKPATGGGSTPAPETPAPARGGGGGGGGGGNSYLISGLSVCQADSKTIEVRWNTNQPTIGRVLFGTSSVPYLISNAFLGYQNATEKNSSPSSSHVVLMNNLVSGTQYFIRPTSAVYQNGSFESAGDELNVIAGGAKPCGTVTQEVTVSNPNTQTSCPFIKDYMRIDLSNDRTEVLKLQNFLKTKEGYDVDETGIFDTKTESAVKALQNKYSDDILKPWGENSQATGYVYITTKNKINNIVCGNSTLNSEEMNIVKDHYESQRVGNATSTTPSLSPVPSSDQNQASTTIIGNLDKGLKAGVSNPGFEDNNKNVATVYEVGSSTSGINLTDKESETFCAVDETPGLLNHSILFLKKAVFGGLQD